MVYSDICYSRVLGRCGPLAYDLSWANSRPPSVLPMYLVAPLAEFKYIIKNKNLKVWKQNWQMFLECGIFFFFYYFSQFPTVNIIFLLIDNG